MPLTVRHQEGKGIMPLYYWEPDMVCAIRTLEGCVFAIWIGRITGYVLHSKKRARGLHCHFRKK